MEIVENGYEALREEQLDKECHIWQKLKARRN